jgi:hypothetical protein
MRSVQALVLEDCRRIARPRARNLHISCLTHATAPGLSTKSVWVHSVSTVTNKALFDLNDEWRARPYSSLSMVPQLHGRKWLQDHIIVHRALKTVKSHLRFGQSFHRCSKAATRRF